jgi:TPR repeat protein
MKFNKLLITGLIVLCMFMLYDFFGRELAIQTGMLAGSERLSLLERYQFKKQADAGNIMAAKRLAGYYGIWRNDVEGQMYWISVAAKLGDPVDQYNYGVYLIEQKHEVDGLKWLKKSADSGYKNAKVYVDEMNKKTR